MSAESSDVVLVTGATGGLGLDLCAMLRDAGYWVRATGRSQADAPELDGAVFLRDAPDGLQAGDVVQVRVEDADAHDLFGVIEPR